jgi:GT2 family glycosyltransferase
MRTLESGARVTVAVPSYNQGRFLDATLQSIFSQPVALEVMIADGGSTDETVDVIEKWKDRLTWVRTSSDKGQASAINEAIGRGRAPFVCWLNSDDIFLPGGLATLVQAIERDAAISVAYGDCLRVDENGRVFGRSRAAPLTTGRLSRRCVIPQPASILRRSAWDKVGGLDESLHFSLDYDLWWRLHHAGAQFVCIGNTVAAARTHPAAKTVKCAREMYAEAKRVVRRHHGALPLIWWLKQPFSVAMRRPGSVLQRITHLSGRLLKDRSRRRSGSDGTLAC